MQYFLKQYDIFEELVLHQETTVLKSCRKELSSTGEENMSLRHLKLTADCTLFIAHLTGDYPVVTQQEMNHHE